MIQQPRAPWFLPRLNLLTKWAVCGIGLLVFANCGIDIVQNAGSNASNSTNQGSGKNGEGTTEKQWRYSIHGVAMVAFYPSSTPDSKTIDPSTGTLNGYMVFYDKPQQTEIAAWSLKDGDCQFETSSYAKQKPNAEVVRGMNGGKAPSVIVGGKTIQLEQRTQNLEGLDALSYIYNIPTQNPHQFPYNQTISYASPGGPEVQKFQATLKAPAKVTITQPKLVPGEVSFPREQDAQLRWSAEGPMEYLAIRINQTIAEKKEVRSLFCRLASTGQGILPAAQLKKFVSDPEGAYTHMFVFSTTTRFTELKGLDAPILTVARATTTVPLKLP
ncbi:MAG: hypothetical protein EP343_05395 [Deltaproteobacteria bacterium]|nr:MAG: hypothetical protein EP343_05395 [Deltaproteobacteria bacterium]